MFWKTTCALVGLLGCLLVVGCQTDIPRDAKPVMTGKLLRYIAPEDGRAWITYNASLGEGQSSKVLAASSVYKGQEVKADVQKTPGDATIWYAAGPALPPKDAFNPSSLVPKNAQLVAKGEGAVLETCIKEKGALHVVDCERREVVLVVQLPSATSNGIRIVQVGEDKILTVDGDSKQQQIPEKFRSSGSLELYFVRTP